MQSQNRLLDDLARVASGALGVATGVRSEVEARLREQFERILHQMDLVTREEHEVALAMAQKAREEQETMAERLAALESRLAKLESGGSKASGAGKAFGAGKASGAGTAKGKSGGSASGKSSGGGKSS